MLLDGCYESSDPTEVPSAFFTPECPGDLLLQFHHPEIAFSLIIGEGYGEIPHECQDLSLVFVTAVKEILRFGLLPSAVFPLLPGNPGDFRFLPRSLENTAIPFFEGSTDGRQQSMPTLPGGIHGYLHLDEEGTEGFAPPMSEVLRDPLQFA